MLSFSQSAVLMRDPTFNGRIQVAALLFANYIIGEPGNVPAHNTRQKWAMATLTNPALAAQQVQPTVVMQQVVQQYGADVSDQDLQTAVEIAVQAIM